MLDPLDQNRADTRLLGGDFNTTTYDLRNIHALFIDLFKKAFWGIPRVVRHYMTPEKHFEKPLFREIARHGYDIDSYNDRNMGTLYFDINNQTVEAKIR